MQDAYAPDTLMPVVLRVLDVQLPRVRAATLKLLASCARQRPPYLASPSHMRACVTKCHPHLADKNAELRRAALQALHALHEGGGPNFVAQVAALPAPTQSTIKTLMLQRSSALEQVHARPPSRALSLRAHTTPVP